MKGKLRIKSDKRGKSLLWQCGKECCRGLHPLGRRGGRWHGKAKDYKQVSHGVIVLMLWKRLHIQFSCAPFQHCRPMARTIRDYDCTQDNLYKFSFLTLNRSMQQDWVIKLISIPIWCKYLVDRRNLNYFTGISLPSPNWTRNGLTLLCYYYTDRGSYW